MGQPGASDDLYVMNAEGSDLTQLRGGTVTFVSWSPDGRKLLLTGWPSNARNTGVPDLYTIRADGTDLVRLTGDEAWEDYAAWSPDGTRIAFSRIEGGDGDYPVSTSEIYVMNADGTGITRLTDSPGPDFFPVWSPLPDKGRAGGNQIFQGEGDSDESDAEGDASDVVGDDEGPPVYVPANTSNVHVVPSFASSNSVEPSALVTSSGPSFPGL